MIPNHDLSSQITSVNPRLCVPGKNTYLGGKCDAFFIFICVCFGCFSGGGIWDSGGGYLNPLQKIAGINTAKSRSIFTNTDFSSHIPRHAWFQIMPHSSSQTCTTDRIVPNHDLGIHKPRLLKPRQMAIVLNQNRSSYCSIMIKLPVKSTGK